MTTRQPFRRGPVVDTGRLIRAAGGAALGLALAIGSLPALSQTIGGIWSLRGPAPAHGGQIENITDRPVTGAVHALAPHPTDADTLLVATVNGGIWRTNNATAASPSWSKVSGSLPTTSFSAIAYDPTDGTRQTLVAATGRVSSYGRSGGGLLGMLRSTNGGTSWTVLEPDGALSDFTITGIAARGATLVAAADGTQFGTTGGIYRSTNTGGSFTRISGATGSGLPLGNASDLATNPNSNAILYTALITGSRGIFRSTNTGATWTRVSDDAIDTALATARRARIAVGNSNEVWVGVVGSTGRLAQVYRSPNGIDGWTAVSVPTTTENSGSFGIHPGGQGGVHFSIVADPTDSNIVYVGGDRQPCTNEGSSGGCWPNAVGANNYSGRLFRRSPITLPGGAVIYVWSTLTHEGTVNNSSPHADSRDMAFDADGNLLEVDDGGVYRRLLPRSSAGFWGSVNGNLAITEYHGIAWDAVSNRAIGGAQDNGTSEQRDATTTFQLVSQADGGDVAVEDWSSTASSTRYSSEQNLGGFRRRTVSSADAVTSTVFPALTPTGTDPEITGQFRTPIATNPFSAARLVIGGSNGVYESTNRGDTVTRISTLVVNSASGDPLVYGYFNDVGFLLFGSGNNIYQRVGTGGTIQNIANLGTTVVDLDINPSLLVQQVAIGSDRIRYSATLTPNFVNIGGNLPSYDPGALRSVVWVPGANPAIVVGADRGVFISYQVHGFGYWFRLGFSLPTAPVFELEWDESDGLLVAGLLGRGAWTLGSIPAPPTLPSLVFRNGFEGP
jgi:hypothetical protein